MKHKQKGTSNIELLVPIGLAVIVYIICFFGSWAWDAYSCSNYGDITDRTTKHSIINGCFVKTDSGWIPQEEMSKRAYGNSITEVSNDNSTF